MHVFNNKFICICLQATPILMTIFYDNNDLKLQKRMKIEMLGESLSLEVFFLLNV